MYAQYDPWKKFRIEVEQLLKQSIDQPLPKEARIRLEKSPEGYGDFTCVCVNLANIYHTSPVFIANNIAKIINTSDKEWIRKCEAKGFYINFEVDIEKFNKITLYSILRKKEKYGYKRKINRKRKKKVIVEHTSANPTDALHVGRARNPIIGDTLARIMKAAGYEVETQYYVDDLGRQAVTLTFGEKIYRFNEFSNEEIRQTNDPLIAGSTANIVASASYLLEEKRKSPGAYQFGSNVTAGVTSELDWAKEERDAWQIKLEHGDQTITEHVQSATDKIMQQKIKPTLKKINVNIDNYIHESNFLEATKDIVKIMKKSQFHGIKDGAHFLDFSQHGIDKEFFFLRSDGTTVYATRDIAYHLWKAEHADILINILGEDHKLESTFVKLTIQEILKKPLSLDVVFYSFVSLPEGKMSTRKGTVVLMDDLLDDAVGRATQEVKKRRPDLSIEQTTGIAESVGIGAVRYNLIKVQPEKKIVFKWEEALNFEGESGPFIQYSHARACGILSKCEECEKYDTNLLRHQSEIALIKKMADLPELVSRCAEKRLSHPIAIYAHELAALFNQFYRDCPVAAAPTPELQAARTALVSAFRICMKNTLGLLGIDALEEM